MIQSRKSLVVFIFMCMFIVLDLVSKRLELSEIIHWIAFGGIVTMGILLAIFYFYDKRKEKQRLIKDEQEINSRKK